MVAVIMALLAAQGVLRPVRQLRAAARELAAGKLDTRLRVRGADELADLANTFNYTAAQLEHNVGEIRWMEARARRFVADVSHELRTPLAAMTTVTDTLDEEADNLHGDAGIAANRDDNGIELITLSLRELLTGPSADEAAVGITSDLSLQPSQTPLQVTSPTPTTVRLVMNMVTDKLSPLAARQITCTVRAAAQAAGRPPAVGVLREHDNGRVESLPSCPENLGP